MHVQNTALNVSVRLEVITNSLLTFDMRPRASRCRFKIRLRTCQCVWNPMQILYLRLTCGPERPGACPKYGPEGVSAFGSHCKFFIRHASQNVQMQIQNTAQDVQSCLEAVANSFFTFDMRPRTSRCMFKIRHRTCQCVWKSLQILY